jgi:hypothetical protein
MVDRDDLDMEFAIDRTKVEDGAPFEERLIGCPIWWLQLVLPVVKSKHQLVVATYVWRRHVVMHRRTFGLSNAELKSLGVNRHTKYRALANLQSAGLIAVEHKGREALAVTILILKPKRRRRS